MLRVYAKSIGKKQSPKVTSVSRDRKRSTIEKFDLYK